ncbi:MAG: response regulator [Pirellulales bacterium]
MSLHILIVDDSPSLRRMVEQSLATSGFTVAACSSAADAVRAAELSPVDVVVTDLNMPETDGIALTRRLRLIPNTAKCPILILTTETAMTRKEEARQAGASGWIVKPFRPETLIRAIQTVSSRSRARA